jgi:hypothetical protein
MLRNLQFFYYLKKRENVFLFANATALSSADNCGKHVYISKKKITMKKQIISIRKDIPE